MEQSASEPNGSLDRQERLQLIGKGKVYSRSGLEDPEGE